MNGNKISFYVRNWQERRGNPSIAPEWVYAVWYADDTGYSHLYHVATFRTQRQLDDFAEMMGFSYQWTEERDDGYKSGRISARIDRNAFDKVSENELAEYGEKEKAIYLAYGIRAEYQGKATKFKSLSNGSIVDNYFLNDGKDILIYRCNPNRKEFYKPLPLREHINFQQIFGIY